MTPEERGKAKVKVKVNIMDTACLAYFLIEINLPRVREYRETTCKTVTVINSWNSLPESVVTASALSSVEARLDRVCSHHTCMDSSEWF